MAQGFKHSFKAADRAELPLVVYNSGFQKCAPGYAWGPGVRDHYLIHYVVSGRGTLELEGRTFRVFAAEYTAGRTDKAPGTVVSAGDNGLEIACAGGETLQNRLIIGYTALAHQIHAVALIE